MKKIIYLLITSLFVLSCSDGFLDRYPKGMWHEGNYDGEDFDNGILARGKLQSAYANMRAWGFCWPALAMHNYTTPDAEKGSTASDGGDVTQFKPMSFTASNSALNDYYSNAYSTIYNTNDAIALATTMPAEEEQEKNVLVAEAVVIRAIMYFRLTQAFGDVPYVDTVLEQDEQTPPRTSKSEIYQKLKTDLNWAIPYLSTRAQLMSTGNPGRVTQNAARAILAKIALYEQNWGDVLAMTELIISSGDNDLTTPYDKIFTEEYEYGPESILEVYVDEKPAENIYMSSQWAEIQGVRGTPNLGWGFNGPSAELMNAYETGDPRKTATVVSNGDVLDGVTIVADNSAYQFFNKKLYTPASERGVYGRSATAHGGWVNIRLIRYADIVLMHAEAANESGNTGEALRKLEMVRARARGGNTNVLPEITDTDQETLREKIRHERRIELALEFERFFDLVRWGIAKDVIADFVVGKHELFPIPQTEIDKSNGILTQNPGY